MNRSADISDAQTLTTRTGLRLLVRSATPDDRQAVSDFYTRVTPDDLRFRFLTAAPRISSDELDRMTKVDHRRTEDFLAFDPDDGSLVATAMLAADEAMERAEVAISVRADRKGQGVGWTLLNHVADFAARKGIKTLESLESRDNRAAISLEKEMGFTACPCPGDSTLMLLQKTL